MMRTLSNKTCRPIQKIADGWQTQAIERADQQRRAAIGGGSSEPLDEPSDLQICWPNQQ
jgi:hypothetical protein